VRGVDRGAVRRVSLALNGRRLASADTIWIVLSSFGYGEDLELKEEVLRPKSVTAGPLDPDSFDRLLIAARRLEVPYDCSVELSPSGYQFLTEIFEIFDQVRAEACCLATRLLTNSLPSAAG